MSRYARRRTTPTAHQLLRVVQHEIHQLVVVLERARDCFVGPAALASCLCLWGGIQSNSCIPSRPPLNLTQISLSLYLDRSRMFSFLGFSFCSLLLLLLLLPPAPPPPPRPPLPPREWPRSPRPPPPPPRPPPRKFARSDMASRGPRKERDELLSICANQSQCLMITVDYFYHVCVLSIFQFYTEC